MIEIIGPTDNAEHAAAEELRTALCQWEPSIAKSANSHIWLIVREKFVWKQRMRELDIIVLACFKGRLPSVLVDGRTIPVESLALVIVVKDVEPSKIVFRGSRVLVQREGNEDDVTDQVHNNQFALKSRLALEPGVGDVDVAGLGWMRGLPHGDLPRSCLQFAGGAASAAEMLQSIVRSGALL